MGWRASSKKEAGTISGACLSMQGEGASYIFYGHVGQLLLGEDLARRGIGPALDYVLRDIEMRLETDVYLLRDAGAGEAVRAAAETGSATRRLEAMEADGGLLSYSMARSVEDALEDLEENGCTFLPSLILSGADRTMEADGYGLIRAGKLAGWASGEAARGVNLLQGQVDADILELPGPGREPIALRIVEAETRVEPIFEADELTGLSVVCRVEANLAESDREGPGSGGACRPGAAGTGAGGADRDPAAGRADPFPDTGRRLFSSGEPGGPGCALEQAPIGGTVGPVPAGAPGPGRGNGTAGL